LSSTACAATKHEANPFLGRTGDLHHAREAIKASALEALHPRRHHSFHTDIFNAGRWNLHVVEDESLGWFLGFDFILDGELFGGPVSNRLTRT
jgi:hypothetical protein